MTTPVPGSNNSHLSRFSKVEEISSKIKEVTRASLRSLPTDNGDGTYSKTQSPLNMIHNLRNIDAKDLRTIVNLVKDGLTNKEVDDREYTMENVVKLAVDLPSNSAASKLVSDTFIGVLWNDLEHPPLSYLGETFVYRQPDGSNNNIMWPQIGKANTPYARSVKPEMIRPLALPPPDVVFDSVLARTEYKEHPNKISSMLFYLASIIIHDLFRTSHNNFNNSTTSSYLDLAPLYGNNWSDQRLMRTWSGGHIKPDSFSETRLLGFPPGVSVLIIMFNRFHNYIATNLALINEGGRFGTKPENSAEEDPSVMTWEEYTKAASVNGPLKYDNDLFQTARLITCGLYINLILKDYVRTILNLNRVDTTWDLDPRTEMGKSLFGDGSPQAVGNQVSAEFNLVYRWHAAVSERDDKWTQELFRQLFPNKQPSEVTFEEFMAGMGRWEAGIPKDPAERSLEGLKREPNGSFKDDDLVNILTESIEDCACEFGARRVPEIFKMVEVLGIKQARTWNLASLNEFRKYFNLKPHKEFKDINSDPYVQDQLRHLYEHPDFVELYPGLILEDQKEPKVPGSGLCINFTISRAVLSDAVALVRGDRFYTVDYHPRNLTAWGYAEANYNEDVDSGHVFYKLIVRAFPHHFKQNSVYAHFPLVIPSENEKILRSLNVLDKYSFDRPKYMQPIKVVHSYSTSKMILCNKIDFKVTWGEAIEFLMQNKGQTYGRDYMLSGDGAPNAQSRCMVEQALYVKDWQNEVRKFYEDTTLKLLREKSYRIAGVNQVDIIRDVGNLVNVHFSANIFSFPLKTKENPRGIFSEAELYSILTLVFICIFFDADPAKSFPLREAARKITQKLGSLTLANVEFIRSTGVIQGMISNNHQHTLLTSYGIHMVNRLLQSGQSPSEIVWSHLLPTSGAMVANQGQLFGICLDYFLDEARSEELKDLHDLAKQDTPESDEKIMRYFMEASRINCPVGLYRNVTKHQEVTDGEDTLKLEPGQRIFVDLAKASMDSNIFPNPEKIRLDRDMDSYIHYGIGPHECLGYAISKIAMTTLLKTVFRLDNLRRAPGDQGKMKKVIQNDYTLYMSPDQSTIFPLPTTMKVQWDGDIPALANEVDAKE